MNFSFAMQQLQINGAKVRRHDHTFVSSTLDYLILGVSNGKPILEVVYFTFVGSVINDKPLVNQYKLSWDDINANDWEIV